MLRWNPWVNVSSKTPPKLDPNIMEEWGASQVNLGLIWLLQTPRELQTHRLLLLRIRQMLTALASGQKLTWEEHKCAAVWVTVRMWVSGWQCWWEASVHVRLVWCLWAEREKPVGGRREGEKEREGRSQMNFCSVHSRIYSICQCLFP